MFVFSINSLRWVLTMPANAVSAMPSASNTMLTVYMMHVLLDLQQPAMVTSVGVFSVTAKREQHAPHSGMNVSGHTNTTRGDEYTLTQAQQQHCTAPGVRAGAHVGVRGQWRARFCPAMLRHSHTNTQHSVPAHCVHALHDTHTSDSVAHTAETHLTQRNVVKGMERGDI